MSTHVRIEDQDGYFLRGFTLPEVYSDDYRDQVFDVPLYNPYNDVIGEPKTMYVGNVWFNRNGTITTTGVPNNLNTADDARRYAAALLAAADAKDENDKPKTESEEVKY